MSDHEKLLILNYGGSNLVSLTLYLDGPVLSNQLVLHFITPQSSLCQVLQQVRIYNLWQRWKTHSAIGL